MAALLNQVHAASSRRFRGFLDGPAFHFRNAGGNGDEHARLDQVIPGRGFFNEVTEHFLRDVEVGDDAVLQRPDGRDGAGGAAQHSLGFVPHGQNLVSLDGDNRGLSQNDALVLDVDQRVGGAQVNANVIGEKFDNFLKER